MNLFLRFIVLKWNVFLYGFRTRTFIFVEGKDGETRHITFTPHNVLTIINNIMTIIAYVHCAGVL